MSDLLSGLEQFGLKKLENMELFREPEKEEKKDKNSKETKKAPVMQEKDYLFGKTYDCPICGKTFKNLTVKTGKARLIGTDKDLRPRYEGIDPLKYDIILCPHCGFATLERYFNYSTAIQKKKIRETICKSFKPREEKDVYNYDDALDRYKIALANSIVKEAADSEKAYICLKMAWLLRGYVENLDETNEEEMGKKEKLEGEETEFLKNALQGFTSANMKESYPICGMDESTVDYLLAVLFIRFENYEAATKLIGGILTSITANSRMKDRARTLKEEVLAVLRSRK